MEDLDLDSFIANIEQSAPQEEADNKHRCQECDTVLEDVDGVFICPNCSAQATNILQLGETELHYDNMGRAILGQRVNLRKKKRKHTIEYGWAWSTDEAIVHLLGLQVSALEKIGLLNDEFRQGVKNMWLKFWIENVAPYIQDDYNEDEMVPVNIDKTWKFRDVEVLFKVQDRVMVPEKLAHKLKKDSIAYKMFDTRFFRTETKQAAGDSNSSDDSSSSSDEENNDPGDRSLAISYEDFAEKEEEEPPVYMEIDSDGEDRGKSTKVFKEKSQLTNKTRNIGRETITVLTVNRTLAFIEATARCINSSEPLFASDIIRACNQRLIPFFGAHKSLPEGIKLNHKDRFLFVKTRPPTPYQLTRTACHLIHKIYRDSFPVLIPVPNLDIILKRFIEDMNLPNELLTCIKDNKINFSSFKQTRPTEFYKRHKNIQYVPQYNRWAFAILLCQLKKLFGLDDKSIKRQSRAAAHKESGEANTDLFVFKDWARQMATRLQLIMSYDPYILFHPMADIKNIETTPQVYNYVATLINDRVTSTTRSLPNELMYDELFRAELSEFTKREIPRPHTLDRQPPDERDLEKPSDVRHPILDAFYRTRRFWEPELRRDREVHRLLFKNFTETRIGLFRGARKWAIHDDIDSLTKLDISPNWPYCFKLLLSIGGYLCYCKPQDLLREVRHVEEFLYPEIKTIWKKKRSAAAKEALRAE